MRAAALLLLAALSISAPAYAPPAGGEFVQAVEFPYYLYPRAQWERELVWLKDIGVRTVEFSIPRNWHETGPGHYDFTGETSPRRDLLGLIRILRRLDLRAWVAPALPPGRGSEDWPASPADPAAERAWRKALGQFLATRTINHGGPVAYVEGGDLGIDASPAPSAIRVVQAIAPDALAASREAITRGRGALLWRGVEDSLYPEGWGLNGVWLRRGAVGLNGEEVATAPLRRTAALLRNWGPLLSMMAPLPLKGPGSKLPDGVSVVEAVSPAASAVSVTNRGATPFADDLHVLEPWSKKPMIIPGVKVPPGESLWLPLGVSLGPDGLCRECSNFSGAEHIVYATAELLAIEYENGILAMEFAAPEAGEAVLQFARKPVGPYLAAGKPVEFEWDDKTLRARLRIPAGRDASRRVRVGIAIEEPETSGFFNEAHRLVIGKTNTVSTTYSSAEIARRSRLLLPPGYTAVRSEKTPNEIEYAVAVPDSALHGDWANLALEADGVLLGRARVQLFRPLSVRLRDAAIGLHFGARTEIAVEPATATIDPRAGTNLEIALRNNSPDIQTFRLEAAGEGLEFIPAKTEIAVGGAAERTVSIRVLGNPGGAGLCEWRLRVSGGADLDLPMRAILVPRGQTVAWSADLDGDGTPEWVLESPRARAVFSSRDGGRWMEFTWKDTNVNFLPEQGALAGAGPVEVRAAGDALEFAGQGWKRTVRLVDAALTVEQSTALPRDGMAPEKRGNVALAIERKSANTVVYRLM